MDFPRQWYHCLMVLQIMLLMCSCSADFKRNAIVPYGEREQYVINRPELSPAIREAILAGDVVPGMTGEQVRLIWGPPTEITTPGEYNIQTDQLDEWWTYRPFFFSFQPIISLALKDGVVVEKNGHYK